jgi:hypothetical protein
VKGTNPPAIGDEELAFARQVCLRLAGRLQGAVSIGVPAARVGAPDPGPFWEQCLGDLQAFAVVLNTVSGTPGSVAEVMRLRQRSGAVLQSLEEFRRCILACLPGAPLPVLRAAAASAARLCDALDEMGRQLALEPDPIARVKAVVAQVFEATESLRIPETSAG